MDLALSHDDKLEERLTCKCGHESTAHMDLVGYYGRCLLCSCGLFDIRKTISASKIVKKIRKEDIEVSGVIKWRSEPG